MANTNDFHLSFGSNAKAFAAQLKNDLKPARAELALFRKELADATAAGEPLGRAMVQLATRGNGGGSGGSGGSGGGNESSNLAQDFTELSRNLRVWENNLDGMISKMQQVVGLVTREGEAIKAVGKAGRASAAQSERYDRGDGTPRGAGGRFGGPPAPPKVDPGYGKPSKQDRREQRERANGMLMAPQVALDKSSIDRLVKAVDKVNSSVKGVRKGVEAIAASNQVGGTVNGSVIRSPKKAAQAQAEATVTESTLGSLRGQLAKTVRLSAVRQELHRTRTGGEFDPGLFEMASGNSKRFKATGERTGFTGAKYEQRLERAIASLTTELKGVPRSGVLRSRIEAMEDGRPEPERKIRPRRGADRTPGGPTGQGDTDGLRAQMAELDHAIEQLAAAAASKGPEFALEADKILASLQAQRSQLRATGEGAKSEAVAKETTATEPARRRRTAEERATRAIEKTARTAEAAEAKKKNGLKGHERADARKNIDLAGTEESLRGQGINKEQLVAIAKTFIQEGYGSAIDYDPAASKAGGQRITNERLIGDILKARSAYDASGGITTHNLDYNADKTAPTQISAAVKRMTGSIVKALKMSDDEIKAYSVRADDRRSGGRDYSEAGGASGVPGKMTIARGQKERGAATGGSREKERAIDNAEEDIFQRTQRIVQARVDKALSLATNNPTFNPYDPSLPGQIVGQGDEAKAQRSALAGLRTATTALDKVMKEFITLADEVKDANRQIDKFDSQLKALDMNDPAQREAARPIQAERNLLAERVRVNRARMDSFQSVNGKTAADYDTPAYRKGLAIREASRAAYTSTAEQRTREMNERTANERTLQESYAELLSGSRANLLVGRVKAGGDPSQMATMLPGLRLSTRNGGQVAPANNSIQRPGESYDKVAKYWKRFLAIQKQLSKLPEDMTPEKAAELKAKEEASYQKMVAAYDALALGGTERALPLASMREIVGGDRNTAELERGNLGTTLDVPDKRAVSAAEKKLAKQLTDLELEARKTKVALEKFKRGVQVVKLTEEINKGTDAFNKASEEWAAKVSAAGSDAERAALMGSKPVRPGDLKTKQDERAELIAQGDAATLSVATPESKRVDTQLRRGVATMEKLNARLADLKNISNPTPVQKRELKGVQRGVDTLAEKQIALHEERKGMKLDWSLRPDANVDKLGVEAKEAEAKLGGLTTQIEATKVALREMQRASTAAPAAEAEAPAPTERASTRQRRRRRTAASGGSGDDGGNDEAPASATGGGSVLERILKKVTEIHALLRNGGRAPTPRTPRASSTSTDPEGTPRTPRTPRAPRAGSTAGTSEEELQELARARALRMSQGSTRDERVISANQRAVRTSNDLVAIQARLSDGTKRLISQYGRLSTSEKTGAVGAEKLVNIYEAMASEFHSLGIRSAGLRQSFRTVMAPQGATVSTTDIQSISRSANIRSDEAFARRAGTNIGGVMGDSARDVFAANLFGNSGFWSRVMNSTGTFIVRNFTAGIVFGLSAALGDVIKQAIETESTFIRVSNALEATGRASGDLRSSLQNISTDYGVALLDVYETAAGLTGLFDGIDEIAGATRVVAQLDMISNGALSAKEGMGALASITSAFTELAGLGGLEHVADVLTTIQNRLGVNIEVSAEGVGRLAGLANQLGLTFEETAVYVSEIAKKTNQTGAAAGEQFSRIVSVMQTGRGQKVLEDNLGETGIGDALAVGDYGQALRLLMGNYQALDKAQQDQIATTIGGQRQAASMAALLKDGAGALDTIAAATYSKGAAEERASAISRTLNRQMAILQSNFVNLGANLVRTGILDAFAAMILGINGALGAINDLLSKMNDFADSNSLTDWVKKIVFALLGLGAALRVVKAGIAGAKVAVASNAATQAASAALRAPLVDLRGIAGRQAADPSNPLAPAMARGRQNVINRALSRPFASSAPNRSGALNVAAPVTRFSRSLEGVASGPLRALGAGLSRASDGLRTLETNAMAAARVAGRSGDGRGRVALNRSAGRFGTAARASDFLAQNASTAGRSAQLVMRGRGDIVQRAQAVRLDRMAGGFATRAATAQAAGGIRGGVQAATYTALSRASATAAASTSRTAMSLNRMAVSAMAAQVAMGLLIAGVALLALEFSRASSFAKTADDAYKARFTSEYTKTEEEKRQEYIGPNDEANKQNQNSLKGFGGFIRSAGAALANPFKTNDEIADRMVGAIPDEIQAAQDQLMRESFDKLTALNSDTTTTLEDAKATQQEIIDAVWASAAEIDGNDDLSKEQKVASRAYYEGVLKSVDSATENIMLNVMGLSKLNKMTIERISALQAMSGFLVSSPTAGVNHPSSMKALANGMNLGSGDKASNKAWEVLQGGNASTAEILGAQLTLTDTMVASAEANYLSKTEPEEIEAAQAKLIELLTTSEQLKRQMVQSEVESAGELATYLEGRGDYAGASASLSESADKLRAAVAASKAQRDKDAAEAARKNTFSLKNAFGTPEADNALKGPLAPRANIYGENEEQQMANQAMQVDREAVSQATKAANYNDRVSAMQTRNATALAGIQLKMANQKLALVTAAAEEGKSTAEDVLAAQEEAVAAGYANIDAQQAVIAARYAASSAGILNSVTKARNDEAGAWQVVAFARRNFGTNSADYLSALATARTASQSTQQALLDEASALRETELARIAPGDMVSRANKTLANAQAAVADAARFGQSSTQYQQATQQLIEAQRGVDTAINGIVDANSALGIALAQAAGKTVDVARLQLEQAQTELQRAQRNSGGARSAEVISAEGNVVSANASLRDATLQDRLDTIDFQKNMDQITTRGAISMLTELLNMKDLTETQRRDLLLKIKGLEDELSSTMEGVFNLPENIKVPTVYEVRRALGVDSYLKTMKDATATDLVNNGVASSSTTANQMLTEIRAALAGGQSLVPTRTEDYSNSNNTVTVNGADFDQVVSWLETALGSGAQVNRAITPRRV